MSTPEPLGTEASGANHWLDDDGDVFMTEPPDDPENWRQVIDLTPGAPLKSYWKRAEGRAVTTPGKAPRSGATIVLTTAAEVAKRDALQERVRADLQRRKARVSS